MMIKEICLIAMVAFGLTLAIPETNVLAQTTLGSHLQSTSLPDHGAKIPGMNVEAQQHYGNLVLGSHLQSTSLPDHGAKIPFIVSGIAGIGLVLLGIAKLKAHKDNPQQTSIGPLPIIK
jgi:hypothetical protein